MPNPSIQTCIMYTIIDGSNGDPSNGGGNQTQQNIIDNIKTAGYSVEIVTPKTQFINPDNSNLNIYENIFNDPQGQIGWFTGEQYMELLSTNIPYLFCESGYTAVTTKPYGSKDDDDIIKLSVKFFLKAKKVILGSPLHQQEIERMIQHMLPRAYLYLREIDTNHFCNKKYDRDIEYLHVGAFNHWKGTDLVLERYNNKGLILAGYGQLPKDIGQAKYIGHIPFEVLPQIYSRAKNYVHIPRWKEIFSRTVAEASLCGCNIISNNNVGALSYKLDLSDPQIYKDSKTQFIDMIKSL